MALREFKLPDPGEGLTEAELVTWHVAVGDTVKVNDVVVEVETAKSIVELPVPFAGTVAALHAAEGDTVEVGTPIITIDDGVGGTPDAGAPSPAAAAAHRLPPPQTPASSDAPPEVEEGLIGGTTSTGRTAVLVGYGVKQTEAKRRPRTTPSTPDVPESTNRSLEAQDDPPAVYPNRPIGHSRHRHARRRRRVRRPGQAAGAQARQGPRGRPRRAHPDGRGRRRHPRGRRGGCLRPAPRRPARRSPGCVAVGLVGEGGERETPSPVKGVRRMTAQAMVASAFTAPHVTEWVTVDVTATMELVERLKKDKEFRDVKVTPLLVLARAMCLAVRRNPGVNASWDEAAQEIVLKHYVNLGIAAATPRGLVVPNVKDADRMSMRELAEAIGALTATAREGRTQPADMAGGTITITNVGVFGVDAGTPILNPGESAILAFGTVARRPWVVTASDGTESIEPRWVTTLALSFDHRLVDGELGSRYLAEVAALLADPGRALVWG